MFEKNLYKILGDSEPGLEQTMERLSKIAVESGFANTRRKVVINGKLIFDNLSYN